MSSTSTEVSGWQTPKSAWFSGAVDTVRLWAVRNRGREALASLDDRMLRDIGLSRVDVFREYRKPFWRE